MKVKNPTVVIQSDQDGHIEVTSTPGVEVVCLDSNYTEISPDELGAEDDDFLDDEPVETPKLDKLLSEPGCFQQVGEWDFDAWDFQRDPETGVYPSGLEAILQAVGAASMCWTNPEHAGTFESERAAHIGQRLYDVLFPPEIGPTNPADEARLAAVDAHIAEHHAAAALAAVRDFNRWSEDLRAPLERRSGTDRRQGDLPNGLGRRSIQPLSYSSFDRRSDHGRRQWGRGRRKGEK